MNLLAPPTAFAHIWGEYFSDSTRREPPSPRPPGRAELFLVVVIVALCLGGILRLVLS